MAKKMKKMKLTSNKIYDKMLWRSMSLKKNCYRKVKSKFILIAWKYQIFYLWKI